MGLLIDAMNGEHAPEAPIRAAALLSLDRDLDLDEDDDRRRCL